MNILLLAQFYPPDIGGEEQHVLNLARALVMRGHRVDVITSSSSDGRTGARVEDGVLVQRVRPSASRIPGLYSDASRMHAPPIADPAMKRAIANALSRRQYDVVHAHNWIVNSALAPARAHKVPVVLTLHDYSHVCATKRYVRQGTMCAGPAPMRCLRCATTHYGATGPAVATLNWVARGKRLRQVDRFVTVSHSVRRLNALSSNDDRVAVIPNFVSDEVFRDQMNPDLTGPVLFVGDLSDDKGIGVLLEAHRLSGVHRPLWLIGRPVSELPADLGPNVVLLGPRPHDEVLEIMASASLVVVPSIVADSCPTVVIEAMALGRPVIASATGGIVDMIEDGYSGVLVPPGDAPALASAIAAIVNDESRALSLAQRAMTSARAFSASSVVQRLVELYRACIEARTEHITTSTDVVRHLTQLGDDPRPL